ncbi:PREDICTED: uncharacterized protein LOC109193124 isoform X2 [Ipomoea nil]|uniref:uncharacterized protein LOC109193124 isoform X2 n=1 Tax=Ipomoea nil TaxID=35883 RepID=UPI000901996A|nr:PREDICTED: uncharacterized protein LOC109193124 isoform X2 [Ipomoea nil]
MVQPYKSIIPPLRNNFTLSSIRNYSDFLMAYRRWKTAPFPSADGGAEESCPLSPRVTNDSLETEMGVEDEDFVEEYRTVSFDVVSGNDENEITEEYDEEDVADIGTHDGEDVLKDVEYTAAHRINENTIANEGDGEYVGYYEIDDRGNALKEVTNGEYIAEMATGDGEDILKEEGKLACIIGEPEHEQSTKNNEEDAEGNEEANHEDELKEEHLANEENEGEALCMVSPEQVENNEHSTEENNKEKVEKSPMQRCIKSRKRKRGKGLLKSSLNKFSSEGKKKKKVPSNAEEDAENEGDALCEDDGTREVVMEQGNGEENTEEDNKKKVEESLKQKLTKYRKRKRGKKKKLEKSVLEKVASEGGGEMCREEMTSNGDNKESLKVGLKGQDGHGLKKGVSKGEALLGSKNVAPQGKDVPESSHRKRPSKKAESAGLIFMCNSETKKDCYRYNILGLPANKREVVENVYKGMRLFLYDVDLKLMYGIYKATGPGGYNIEPKAFKSQFPSQVRFMVVDDCKPLAEEIFKKAIKKNYYTRMKFNCQLTSEQVKDLCKLFTADSRGSTSKKLRGRLKKESKRVVERDSTGKREVIDKARRLKPERKRGLKQDRSRKYGVDRDRRRSPVRDHRYHEYSHHYEKDMVAPAAMDHLQPLPPAPVAQGSHLLTLRPLASAQPYVYERPLETDAYRRGPLLVRDDPYRRDMLQEPQDILIDRRHYYRQEPKPERHYSYEIANYDPHASYLGRGEAVYQSIPSAGLPVEYYSVEQPTAHRSAGVSLPEYHAISRSLPEYHSVGLRPEYQSSAGGIRRYPY